MLDLLTLTQLILANKYKNSSQNHNNVFIRNQFWLDWINKF